MRKLTVSLSVWRVIDQLMHDRHLGQVDWQRRKRRMLIDQSTDTSLPIRGKGVFPPVLLSRRVDSVLGLVSTGQRHFEIASFLLGHGANVNTDWSRHEPASILHECAVRGDCEAAQFLIDYGIDMTIRDHRWNATEEVWAYYAAQDEQMAEFLAIAERARIESAY
ncbi:MAG: hypothetical protein P4L46_02730 [Fimbriimonas sp.]|nr:hypothetical protein [Fimbriimonas sp.]